MRIKKAFNAVLALAIVACISFTLHTLGQDYLAMSFFKFFCFTLCTLYVVERVM